MGPDGGTNSIAVSVSRECAWSASSTAGWLSITSGAQGQGDGSISYRVDPNPDPVTRSSALVIGEGRLELTQQAGACRFSVARPPDTVAATGGTLQAQVRTHAVCNWSASSDASWATVAPAAGRGDGTVTITVGPNAADTRAVVIVIADDRMGVTQAGVVAPPPAPPPAPPQPPPPPPSPPPPPPPPPPGEDVELDGRLFFLFGSCPAVRFVVDGTVVLTNDQTRFKRGSCNDLENGERVRVKGRRRADGFVEATEVERR